MESESMFFSLKLMRLWKWIRRDSQGFMGICKNLLDFGNGFVRIHENLGDFRNGFANALLNVLILPS